MRRGSGSAGFSLPEVTLALALLGGVLISLSGLFVMSEGLVHGGQQQTVALSIARDILEETGGWHFEGLYDAFGLDGSAASYTIDTRSNARAAIWQAALDAELEGSHAEIVLESITESGSPPPLNLATGIRLTVTVYWSEGPRSRSVGLATVRM